MKNLKLHDIDLVRERLHEQIAGNIQELVAARELQPGDRLPPERDLAEFLNVSRPTVRDALRLLQHRGLVTMKPGSGTYVTEMGTAPVAESIERFFSVKDCSYEDLMQVRELLEPGAAAMAAANATPEDIRILRQGVETLEQAFQLHDSKRLALAESSLHRAIVNASKNELLIAVYAGIAHLVEKWIGQTSTVVFAEDVNKHHRVILDAIAAGDLDRAREAMASHMRMSRQVLLDTEVEE
jgi:GntR family transcriptional repressor for pyruvate dehydrogenase complex